MPSLIMNPVCRAAQASSRIAPFSVMPKPFAVLLIGDAQSSLCFPTILAILQPGRQRASTPPRSRACANFVNIITARLSFKRISETD